MATIYAGKGVVNSTNPYISLTVSQGTQSIDGNYTMVPYELKVHRPGTVNSSASKNYSFTINGTTYSGTYTIGGSGDKTIKSGTLKVPHNADGTESIAFSINTQIGVKWSGTDIGYVTASGSMTLSTIPRATTPTLSLSSAEMGTQITINLPRAANTFTHDLSYSFAGSDYVSIATGVATSTSWIIPDLSEDIPDAANGTVTIKCVTKSGSTTIGTKTVVLTAIVPAEYVPSISSIRRSEATAGLAAQFGAYVQGKSKLNLTIDGTGVAGSTIKAYQTTLDGVAYEGQSFTTELLATAGTLELRARVQDSRGRWSDYMTWDVEVLPYAPPQIQKFTAYRSDSSGNPKNDGEYLTATLQYSVSPLGNKNTAQAVVGYDQAPADSYTALLSYTSLSLDRTVTPTNKTFTSDSQFDLQFEVTDWFGAKDTAYAWLPTADVVLDINADGTAISFGKVSEVSDSMEVARDPIFYNLATFEERAIFKSGYGSGYDVTDSGNAAMTLTEVGGGKTAYIGSEGTGILKVLLPQDFNKAMIKFDVEILSYSRQVLATYSFGGQLAHNTDTGVKKWSSPSYHVRGTSLHTSENLANLPISFGRHNEKAAVSIGLDSTTWGYCMIRVKNVMVFNVAASTIYWADGWQLFVDTDPLDEINNSYTAPGEADRVVERGVISNWSYEKKASGDVTCRRYLTSTVKCTTASGSVYCGSVDINLPSGLFTEVENIHVSAAGSSGAGYAWFGRYASVTNTGFNALFFATVSATKDIAYSIEVTGRWK